MISGYGQYHTNESDTKNPGRKLTPYIDIDLAGIRALVDTPQQVDKAKAQWLIPSQLHSRTFKTQEAEGRFSMLWADLDEGRHTVEQLAALLTPGGFDYEIYTSRSATEERQKARILIPLSQPLCGGDWLLFQEVLNDILQAAGIAPDRKSEGAAQLCYLPNRGEYYDSRSRRAGAMLNPLSDWSEMLDGKRNAIEEHAKEQAAKIEALKKSSAERRESLSLSDAPDTIGAFNHAYSVQEIMVMKGYAQKGDTFRHPQSESGSYSASVMNGRVHSLSSSDPLFTGGGGVGAHSPFSVFTVLYAGGDTNAALKLAGDQWLMIGGEPWNKVKQREYMQDQAQKKEQGAEHQADAENAPEGDRDGWPEPQPLSVKVEPEPYPIDALPLSVRAAVEEVAGFVKAPVPLVAMAALAALSLACQSHYDVKRAEKLFGPILLYLLCIADSGERKSTCEGFFMPPIRDYEARQAEAAKPILKDHKAAIEAWEAKRGGVKEKIRQLAKDNKPTAGMESALRDLEHDKPEPPRIPRLLYADATPEALAYGLAKQWPSGGVISAEAGIVFGSHGMGKDSAMRNMAMLNQLWDGNSLTIDRRTTESFTVKGARVTMSLQVQEPTLREFFKKSGALARGTGFLARFLVAWPESTQGQRPFTEAPATWPHLAAFHRRIAAILEQPAPIDDDGALTPPMLPLTPEAKAAWVEYHNAIESELSCGGELYDVRDVASKSADNAARLAALFQIFEGAGGAIGAEAFEGASRITAWHLNEARRFFGELALPPELADAAQLDSWVIEHCKRKRTHMVPVSAIQKSGPSRLRSKAEMELAVRELEELNRMRMVCGNGKARIIKVNPGLLGFAAAVIDDIAVIDDEKGRKTAITAKAATATATEGGAS